MNNKLKPIGLCAGVLFGLFATAQAESVASAVARAAAHAGLHFSSASYVVHVTAHFKKESSVQDYMFRPVRRPANPKQVISVEESQKTCQGVVVSQGARVIVPEVCVNKSDYELDRIVIRLATDKTFKVSPQNVAVKEDIAWITVNPAQTKSVPYVAFTPVATGKSLQDVFGAGMTEHLKRFFRERGVVEHRTCRVGMTYSESRLQVGEPLFYKGKLVALVKTRTKTYGGVFGGVSESALAIIR